MSVITALRISFSIPIVFNRVLLDDLTYIDGGVVDNFPINLFKQSIDETLGLYIKGNKDNNNIESLDSFIINILLTMNRKIDNFLNLFFICRFSKITCSNHIRFNKIFISFHTMY